MSAGTKGGFMVELGRVFEPIGAAAVKAANGKPGDLEQLLSDSGLDRTVLGDAYDQVKSRSQRLGTAWDTIETKVIKPTADPNDSPDFEDFDEIIDALGTIIDVISSMNEISVDDADVDRIGELLLDYLLIAYLAEHRTVAYSVLSLFGVISLEGPGTAGDIDLSRIEEVFSNPNAAIQDGFEWGTVDFEPYLVLFYLKGVVDGFGLPAELQPVTKPLKRDAQGLGENESWPGVSPESSGETTAPIESAEDLADDMLHVDVLSMGGNAGTASAGFNIVPVPAKNDTLPGFALVPFGQFHGEMNENLDGGWTFNADISAGAHWVFRAMPKQGGGLHTDRGTDKSDSEFHAEASLEFDPSEQPDAKSVLGDGEQTEVGIRYFRARVAVHSTESETRVVIEIPAKGNFRAEPEGGFLGSVLPDGIEYDFDTTLGWDSETGLYFERGGTLEASIPMNLQLGPLALSELYTQLDPGAGSVGGAGGGSGGAGSLTLTAASSGSLSLGPVTASVRRMGVDADIELPENGPPTDIDVSFKPPTGVGLSLDEGPVTGSGTLNWDEEGGYYAGSVTVNAEDITVGATGILMTELPDGSDGFSLILVFDVDFKPIQLGLGFSLNGVGGVIGINRGLQQERLRKAVLSGDAGSVLDPTDATANTERLVSDIGEFFPARKGSHVLGPTAELGWSGELITANVGVILEVPSFSLSLLGVISAHLPDENAPIIELNMGVSGVLDPPNKRLAIDASLFDSRVVLFTLKGDMAMRTTWGSNPRFLLSVGGFHPRYQPPGSFPDLNRVTATLGKPGGNPRLEFTGYFAVTSNTLQAGAKLYAVAEAGPARVEGHLAFDALIQYNPFKFVVDISASISVTVYGKGLSLTLNGTLKGPAPFHVKGTVTINIFLLSVSANVNVTLGESRSQGELPSARVLPELVEALEREDNWTTKRPADGIEWATYREREGGGPELLAHPFAEIGVRQTVVPLAFRIERFGKAVPSGYMKFTITGASTGEMDLSFEGTTAEQFSPSEYLELSKDEKLDSEPFRSLEAGRKVRTDEIYYGDGDSRTTRFEYECSVIDRAKDNYGRDLSELGRFGAENRRAISGMVPGQVTALADVGAVANAPARNRGAERFRLSDDELEAAHAVAAGQPVTVPGTDTDESDDAAADGGDERRVVRGGETPDVGGLAQAVTVSEPDYTVVRAEDMRPADLPDVDTEMTKTAAQRVVSNDESCDLRVVPTRRARTKEGYR
jgi:hypothetical protein